MTPALSIKGLKKTYANDFQALKGIDLQVEQGDFFALLGPNGAGKSTTLGVLSGLVQKTEGQVAIMGHDIETDVVSAKRCLGVVPQEFNFNQFEKVRDIIITQAGYYGLKESEVSDRAEHLLKSLDLWEKRNNPSRELSGGMKRRLMIARALIHDPQILLLDEPTAGVDIELRRSMWTFLEDLNQQGTTIILTTHYLEEAEQLCRNIAIINKGDIIQNTSMRDLLGQLQTETFVFDLAEPIEIKELEGYQVAQVTEDCIEVTTGKDQPVNKIFALLDAKGAQVSSMRTKANRLEELFVSLVKDHSKADKPSLSEAAAKTQEDTTSEKSA